MVGKNYETGKRERGGGEGCNVGRPFRFLAAPNRDGSRSGEGGGVCPGVPGFQGNSRLFQPSPSWLSVECGIRSAELRNDGLDWVGLSSNGGLVWIAAAHGAAVCKGESRQIQPNPS